MRRVIEDALILAASVVLAVYLIEANAVSTLVSWTGSTVLASFIGGLFYSSMLTVAPATVVLAQLAERAPVWVVVAAGAVGTTLVDYVLFWFISRRLGHHARGLVESGRLEILRRALKHSRLRFVLSIIGALFIALPLPDEIGLVLLGVSSVKPARVVALSFVFNVAGILVICLVGRSFA